MKASEVLETQLETLFFKSLSTSDMDRQFAALGPDALPGLIALLRRKQRRRSMSIGGAALVLGFWVLFSFWLMLAFPLSNAGSNAFSAGLPIAIGFAIWAGRSSRIEKNGLDLLARLDDPRAVEPLLASLPPGGNASLFTSSRARYAALLRLLPKLTPEDILPDSLLPKLLRQQLSAMTVEVMPEFQKACLCALAAIRDREALPLLYIRAHMDAPTQREKERREVAREALAQLEASLTWDGPEIADEVVRVLPTALTSEASPYTLVPTLLRAKHLLPSLSPDQYRGLEPKTRHRLHAFLNTYSILYTIGMLRVALADVLVVALDLIRRAEDTRAIDEVRRIVLADAGTQQEKRVREAARNAYRVLDARAERERTGATLLRAAAAPAAAPVELLRPASEAGSTPQSQLLRPTDGGT